MAQQSGVFVIQSDDTLVPMHPTQFSTELDFQLLLTKFPALLVGDQINPENPRRFMLVKQEQAIGNEDGTTRWSIDHLFLDQDGIPTLVEVKRQSDSRIRREVVGQMLDYASNCQAYWTTESMQVSLEETCKTVGKQSEDVLRDLIGPEGAIEAFWLSVRTNLQAGRLRMLFVADKIPVELRRIVEFLNEQMNPAEMLAIELRQFTGQGFKTVVPMVFGQTQEAASKRSASLPGTKWTEERLFEKLRATVGDKEIVVARAIFDWMTASGYPMLFGTGKENGSAYPLLRPQDVTINPAYLSSDGKLYLQFAALQNKPVFGERADRKALLDKFALVDESGLADTDLERYPNLPLSRIAADPEGLDKVLEALNWMLQKVRAADA